MTSVDALNWATHVLIDIDALHTGAPGSDAAAAARRPHHLLGVPDPISAARVEPTYANGRMPALPGRIRTSGRHVTICSDSPLPYSATLLGLLDVDPVLIVTDGATPTTVTPRSVYVGQARHPLARWTTSRGGRVVAPDLASEINDLDGSDQLDELPPGVAGDDVAGLVRALWNGGGHHRHALQQALATAADPAHRYCLVNTSRGDTDWWLSAGLRGCIFTREEATARPAIFNRLMRALFPMRSGHHDGFPHRWFVPFNSRRHEFDPLGRLIADVKDYRAPQGSGPDVRLQPLRLVSDVLGAHLRGHGVLAVEPIPASPFSRDKPGRISLWLAGWVATRAMCDVVEPLSARRWAASPVSDGPYPASDPDEPWIVDDQFTRGSSARTYASLRPRPAAGIITWSTSHTRRPTAPTPIDGCRWPDAPDCPIHAKKPRLVPTGPVQLTRTTQEPIAPPHQAEANTAEQRTPVSSEDVFQALRRWRRDEAGRQGVPAFVIFHDATLREIASHAPTDEAELLATKGIGPVKLEMYGQQVLAILDQSRR